MFSNQENQVKLQIIYIIVGEKEQTKTLIFWNENEIKFYEHEQKNKNKNKKIQSLT